MRVQPRGGGSAILTGPGLAFAKAGQVLAEQAKGLTAGLAHSHPKGCEEHFVTSLPAMR